MSLEIQLYRSIKGYNNVVELLLENSFYFQKITSSLFKTILYLPNTDINQIYKDKSLLTESVTNNRLDLIIVLLEREDVDINQLPLINLSNNEEIIEYLINKNADYTSYIDNDIPIYYSLLFNGLCNLYKKLEKNIILYNDEYLFYAIYGGCLNIITEKVNNNNINTIKDINGKSLLMYAIITSRFDIFHYLINLNINIELKDNFGNTILHHIMMTDFDNEETGNIFIYETLEHTPNPYVKNIYNKTPKDEADSTLERIILNYRNDDILNFENNEEQENSYISRIEILNEYLIYYDSL